MASQNDDAAVAAVPDLVPTPPPAYRVDMLDDANAANVDELPAPPPSKKRRSVKSTYPRRERVFPVDPIIAALEHGSTVTDLVAATGLSSAYCYRLSAVFHQHGNAEAHALLDGSFGPHRRYPGSKNSKVTQFVSDYTATHCGTRRSISLEATQALQPVLGGKVVTQNDVSKVFIPNVFSCLMVQGTASVEPFQEDCECCPWFFCSCRACCLSPTVADYDHRSTPDYLY
jgi:hypothetical protein